MQKMMKIAVVMAKAAGILLYRAAQRPEIAHGSTPGARKRLPKKAEIRHRDSRGVVICAYKSLAGSIFLPRLLRSGDAEAGRLGALGYPDKLGRHVIGLGLLRDPDKLGRHVIGLGVLRYPDKLGRHVIGLAEAGRGRGAFILRGGVERGRGEQNRRRRRQGQDFALIHFSLLDVGRSTSTTVSRHPDPNSCTKLRYTGHAARPMPGKPDIFHT